MEGEAERQLPVSDKANSPYPACCDLPSLPCCQSQEMIKYWRTHFGQILKEPQVHVEAMPRHLEPLPTSWFQDSQLSVSSTLEATLLSWNTGSIDPVPASYPVVLEKKKATSLVSYVCILVALLLVFIAE